MTTTQLREQAARRIERFGWTRGRYGSERVGYCMLGALIHESVATERTTAGDLYLDVIGELLSELRQDPTTWNDEYAASAEEVTAALRGQRVTTQDRQPQRVEPELVLV